MVILGVLKKVTSYISHILDLSCASKFSKYKKKEQNFLFYCFNKIMVYVSILVMWEK